MVYTKEVLEQIKNDMSIRFPLKPDYPRLDPKTADRILKKRGLYEVFEGFKKSLRDKQNETNSR